MEMQKKDKKYGIGDKFIIEIDDVMYSHKPNNTDSVKYLYRVKGINTLVLDAYGLDRLQTAKEYFDEVITDTFKDEKLILMPSEGEKPTEERIVLNEPPQNCKAVCKNEIVLVDNYQAQQFICTLRSNEYKVEVHRFIQGCRQYVLLEWA